mgnify:CR=1 FL=1
MILFRNNLEDIAADALRDYYRVLRPSDTSRISEQLMHSVIKTLCLYFPV